MPLGLVKLKQGTYSVELTSGGTTLTPFKATIKPSAVPSAQDVKEKDSTFQQLPQSASQPIDGAGNAPLPEQIDLVTQDDKLKAANQALSADIEGLPKSQNQPLDNPRPFLTADQVNGQKEVQIEGSTQAQSNQTNQLDKVNNEDALKTVQIGEMQSGKSTEISSNQPLSESNERFSSNQILPNGEQNVNFDTNINNPLPNSNEQISKNNTLPISGFNLSADGSPISQNLPLDTEASSSISQNAPLGLNADGTPISQALVDINGAAVTENRPLESSSETFTSVTPLASSEDTNIQSDTNTGYTDYNKTTEYEKLPEISQPVQEDQADNQTISQNIPFDESANYSSEAQKLSDTPSVNLSQNIGFQDTDQINYSENQKLTDSTSFQNSKTEGTYDSDAGYQKLPDNTNAIYNQDGTIQEDQNQTTQGAQSPSRLNYNNISQNNELQSNQESQIPGQTSQLSDQDFTPGQTSQLSDQEFKPGQTSQLPGQEISETALQPLPSGQIDQPSQDTAADRNQVNVADSQNSDNQIANTYHTNDITTSADFKTVSGSLSEENVDKLLSQDGKSPEYITRTIGTTEPGYEAEEFSEEQQSSNRILSSTLMQSGARTSGENTFSSNNESSISSGSDYVKVGETTSLGTNNQFGINNFNFDTDMPDEFYSFKGSRTIPNSELLEEFIKSEQFSRLDETSKSTVLSARQSLQLPAFNPPISQEQPGVTSGTTLQGSQSLQAAPLKESRGLAKLFTRKRQDRPERKSDKAQEQIQKEFEEANGLKQKISLTLNKVFGNNERSIGLPEYPDADTAQNTGQTYEQLQNNFDDEDTPIGEEDYQFGDEDKIYSSPRITGVRETLDEDYQEELRKRRRRRRNLRYLPVGADLEPKFLPINDDKAYESLPEDEETNLYRQFTGERDRFQALNISEQEQNKIALRKAEHDIQQELNKALEENINIKEAAENQATEASADAETVFYKELIKERERFQQALLEEREQNKAALRRSEDQIQRQLIDVLTSNPQAAPTQSSNDPISQVVRSLVDSGKDKEEIIIDATRIIQMIQNTQAESGAQEIDEYLLRQRIERELKYEFKQMQLEHEQKMKLIYRRMIEDMYIDMLNS